MIIHQQFIFDQDYYKLREILDVQRRRKPIPTWVKVKLLTFALNFVARAEREEPLPSLAMRSQSWRSSPRCCSPSTWSCSQSCSPSTLRSPARCTNPPPPRLVRGSTRTPVKPVVCPRGTSLSLSFSFVFSRFHRSAAITLIQRKSQVWPLASSEKGLISEKTRVSSRTLSIRLYLLSFVCLHALLASSTISLYSEVLNWPDNFFLLGYPKQILTL